MGLAETYNYVINACNDPYIGYSQSQRTTGTLGVTYRTYFDCTSLMSKALTVGGYFSVNPWFYSGNMRSKMASIGWTEYSAGTTPWQAGDILLRIDRPNEVNHAEMVYQGDGTGGYTMGAHLAKPDFADQVSINTFRSDGSQYDYIYRAPDAGLLTRSWHQSDGSGGLTTNEIIDNAVLIRFYFASLGATEETICAILGNLQFESGLDPNKYYGGVIGSTTAYGLPQFHPTSKYQDLATAQGVDITDADDNGSFQCQVIGLDLLNDWYPTTDYPYTLQQFFALTDLETATRAFCFCYERPGNYFNPQRLTNAQAWYGFNWPADSGSVIGRSYIWLWGALWDLRRRKHRL